MKIKAISQIIEWDAEAGQTAILNEGDVGEVSDGLAARLIADGAAKKASANAKVTEQEPEAPADLRNEETTEATDDSAPAA